jgi:hypothetical protein
VPTYDDLVAQLEHADGKQEKILALRNEAEEAKPALLRGMEHPAWRVRHGCLLVLDHTVIDDPTRRAVLKALEDPHRKVRKAALHVLGCEPCKPPGYCGIEGVNLEELYLDTARHDASGRVRRSAIGHFMWRSALDDELASAMHEIIAADESDDVRKRAAMVLAFPVIAGMAKKQERHAVFTETVHTLLTA